MLQWDESMTTGIAHIDAQHKEIIKKYNQFSQALARGIGASREREEAGKILDYLQFYAAWHFEREEECFDQYKCPAAKANKNAHTEFLKRFGDFYEYWHTEGMDSSLVKNTFQELGEWIATHIMRLDTQIYPCVKQQEPKS
jgi:hemerythrin